MRLIALWEQFKTGLDTFIVWSNERGGFSIALFLAAISLFVMTIPDEFYDELRYFCGVELKRIVLRQRKIWQARRKRAALRRARRMDDHLTMLLGYLGTLIIWAYHRRDEARALVERKNKFRELRIRHKIDRELRG